MPLSASAKQNIETISRVEQQHLEQHSRLERIGDFIARFFGSPLFIVAHATFFAVWIAANSGAVSVVRPFDAYPFAFLGFIVGVEFFFLTTFVLMNQRLLSRRQEKWSHLTLQIGLLTEQEVTKNMQMLHHICQHLGLENSTSDREVTELKQATPVTALVEEIEKARKESEANPTGV